MKVLRYSAPRHAEIVTVPDPTPQSGEFITRSLFCDISAGTEMGFYRGTTHQLNTVNNAQGNFDDHANAMTYPMQSNNPGTWWMGYSNVSEVSAVGSGVTEVKVGDVIYAQKPHKTVQIFSANEPWWKVPAGIDYRNACLTALTGIALNGILDSGIRLKENVVVFGCGMLGTLVIALAKRSGARVIAVDALPQRLEGASKAGADEVIDLTKSADVAADVYALTENRGADLVIEVSGNINALSTAMRAVACCGRVVCLSFYADGAPALNLGREFHYKHINLISSQICNLNPALLKWWDDDRRTRTALALTHELNVKQYVTHYVGFEALPAALEMIDKHSSECGAVCVDYSK